MAHPLGSQSLNGRVMLKNYLLVAFRNFSRNKVFSVINILGLSIGISASLVIFLIVQYAYSFDRFEKNAGRMFRVVSDYSFQGEPGHTRGIPAPLANAIGNDLSGIDNIVSFRYYSPEKVSTPSTGRTNASSGATKNTNPAKPTVFKYQPHIIFADAHYFDMLPYRWLAGNI